MRTIVNTISMLHMEIVLEVLIKPEIFKVFGRNAAPIRIQRSTDKVLVFPEMLQGKVQSLAELKMSGTDWALKGLKLRRRHPHQIVDA